MTPTECPFCNIDPEWNPILFPAAYLVVVLSNPRIVPGHVLVIPKRHVGSLYELPLCEMNQLFQVAVFFQRKIKEKIVVPGMITGCDILQHDRPFMPITKLSRPDHAHIHLRPRFFEDELYSHVQAYETDLFRDLTDFEKKKFQKLLKE